jgi:hypothetical protein
MDIAQTEIDRFVRWVVMVYPNTRRVDLYNDGLDLDYALIHLNGYHLAVTPVFPVRLFTPGPKWPWWKPKTKFFLRRAFPAHCVARITVTLNQGDSHEHQAQDHPQRAQGAAGR